ncbi:MAG: ribonuclease H-like domain-containing protein, partial [Candidatus Thermoplasmatota archaeon]|nr:ribonuclease H-like domain-containing protein [Candidatus Thermoplasmatota archaeon]
MRLLHLPEEAVRGHTEEEILDLERYFKPDLTISSGFTGAKKRVLEDKGNSDILHIEEVDKYWIKETESETILILRDSDSVDHLSRDSFIGENTSVITDMIREEVGRISYERSLKKVSIIDELSDIFDDFHTFSTGVEAERQHHYNGKKIHGLGPVIDREGVKIPFLKTGETPKVKSFPAERVGLLAIPGLGKKFSTKLKSRGIVDRKKLKEKNPEEIMDLEGVGPHRGTKWISSAEAIENECVYTIQENELEDKHKIYLDIETDSLDPSIVWHIGLYDDKEEEYTCLMEKEPEKKGRIMKRFGEYLEEHCGPDSVLLAWYGSGFDFKVLENF